MLLNNKGIIEARLVEKKSLEELVLDGKILNICKICYKKVENSKHFNEDDERNECVNCEIKHICCKHGNSPSCVRCEEWSERDIDEAAEILGLNEKITLSNLGEIIREGQVLNICKMCHLQAEYYDCCLCEIKGICDKYNGNAEWRRCEGWSKEDIERAYNILEVK